MGERCDQCKPGFHSLDPNNPNGCSPCDCDDRGSVTRGGSICDPLNGQCHCKSNVTGGRCDTCAPHTYGLSSGDADGCKKCRCDIGGSLNQNCNTVDGKTAFLEYSNKTFLLQASASADQTLQASDVTTSRRTTFCRTPSSTQ